jgi:death on curing protein
LQSPIRYLTVADVVALHRELLERMGDVARPLLDEGKLESAVMRPQFAAQYANADLIRQATLLGVGISQAQAFEDGNKRIAYLALRLFLRVNGHRFVGDALELARELIAVAERQGSLDAATERLDQWLRHNVEPEPSSEP